MKAIEINERLNFHGNCGVGNDTKSLVSNKLKRIQLPSWQPQKDSETSYKLHYLLMVVINDPVKVVFEFGCVKMNLSRLMNLDLLYFNEFL